MNFNPSEEQRLFAASIERFVARDYPFEARRHIVASHDGYSRNVWAAFADLGLLGVAIPSEYGGLGGNAADLATVMEAIGEALIVEPFLATVMGARFIARAGTLEQKTRLLAATAEGKLTMAFAHSEQGARYDLARVATRARRTATGFAIDGDKRVVLHGPCARMLVVSARVSGDDADPQGIGLFLVDTEARGVSLASSRTLDELRAADISLSNVHVPADAQLGETASALTVIEDVVDFATALVCSEAVGAIRFANSATLEYLKTRKQFGVPIGSFQALQHRMVDMVVEYEQAKSMASLACATVDTESDPVRRKRVVSAAKVRIADACRRVSQESVQLHGGMGMSDELKISHTFRRLTMITQQFGDADHHLERFASM
ncbi:MAG TPA: acyl-CoA dehydrogenase [Casimicrobiaceae bacterium]|jgi:alkylation response protein AidB-like acyl-CoA dehydrogenase